MRPIERLDRTYCVFSMPNAPGSKRNCYIPVHYRNFSKVQWRWKLLKGVCHENTVGRYSSDSAVFLWVEECVRVGLGLAFWKSKVGSVGKKQKSSGNHRTGSDRTTERAHRRRGRPHERCSSSAYCSGPADLQ